MNLTGPSRAGRLLVPVAALVMAGCAGAPGEDVVVGGIDDRLQATFDNPLPDVLSGFEPLGRLSREGEPFPTGSGNWAQGDYVYGSALGEGFFIADVSDVAAPVLLFQSGPDSPTPYARKAEVVTHDGRLTLALATQSEGVHLWDVTDPRNPTFASVVDVDINHYVAQVPGAPIVLSNPSGGVGRTNTFIDVSDPGAPRILGTFGAHGCHGTVFKGSMGNGLRAYCAAIQRTEIWDLDGFDPAAPELGIRLLGVVEGVNSPVVGNPALIASPARSLHHLATTNDDQSILIIGDEHNGGGSPGACFFRDEATGTSTPLGALWFYDIRDPAVPQRLGHFSPPTVMPQAPSDPIAPFSAIPNCTAHFGEVVPGHQAIVIAWYRAGVLLVDFGDPMQPRLVAQHQPEGVNVWSARVHQGHVFTGDIGRGMDTLKLI